MNSMHTPIVLNNATAVPSIMTFTSSWTCKTEPVSGGTLPSWRACHNAQCAPRTCQHPACGGGPHQTVLGMKNIRNEHTCQLALFPGPCPAFHAYNWEMQKEPAKKSHLSDTEVGWLCVGVLGLFIAIYSYSMCFRLKILHVTGCLVKHNQLGHLNWQGFASAIPFNKIIIHLLIKDLILCNTDQTVFKSTGSHNG